MQTPTSTETSTTTTTKTRSRPSPLLAAAAAVLVALLAAILFVTHAPHAQHQLGIQPPTTGVPNVGATSGPPEVTPAPGVQTPIQSDIKSYSLIMPQAGSNRVIPKNPTSVFTLGQNIYIVMNLSDKAKAGDMVSAEWFFNNVDVTPDMIHAKPDCCSMTLRTTGKATQVLFQFMDRVATGSGKVQISYNGKLAYTILFTVVAQGK